MISENSKATNKPLQQSLDPAVPFAAAKPTSASSAAELNRYWAMSAAIASFRFQPETEDY